MFDLRIKKDLPDREIPLLTLNDEELIETKLTKSLLCSVVVIEIFDKEGTSICVSAGTLESFTKD